MAESRREFLKRTAAAGTLAWAAPAVLSVSRSYAGALYGSCCPMCTARANALVQEPDATVDPLAPCRAPDPTGQCCEDDYSKTPAEAERACATADPHSCRASVAVRNVRGSLSSFEGVEVGFASSCVECGRGSSVVRDVFLVRRRPPYERIPVEVPEGCNVEAGGFVFNEQTCVDGTLVVTALRTRGLGGVPIIIAQSRAGGPGCPCTPCASGGCSPPSSV